MELKLNCRLEVECLKVKEVDSRCNSDRPVKKSGEAERMEVDGEVHSNKKFDQRQRGIIKYLPNAGDFADLSLIFLLHTRDMVAGTAGH